MSGRALIDRALANRAAARWRTERGLRRREILVFRFGAACWRDRRADCIAAAKRL